MLQPAHEIAGEPLFQFCYFVLRVNINRVVCIGDKEEDHVPTANKVTRIFGGVEDVPDQQDDDEEDELAEIDFNDIGKFQAEVDAVAASLPSGSNTTQGTTAVVEEKFTGFYVDRKPSKIIDGGKQSASTQEPQIDEPEVTEVVQIHTTADQNLLYVDTKPSIVVDTINQTGPRILVDQIDGLLGQANGDDEIVYNAPNPRSGPASPSPAHTSQDQSQRLPELESVPARAEVAAPVPTLLPMATRPGVMVVSETTILTAQSLSTDVNSVTPSTTANIPPAPAFSSVSFTSLSQTPSKPLVRKLHPVHTPRSFISGLRPKRARRTLARTSGMGRMSALGAAVSDANVRSEGKERDPRRAEQRRTDSDIEWGTDSDDGGKPSAHADADEEVDVLSSGVGAMELDGELDIEALKSFVKSMGAAASNQVTLGDVEDEEKMRKEDEEAQVQRSGSSGESEDEDEEDDEDEDADEEVEAVFQKAEEAMVDGNAGEEDEKQSDDDDEDDEDTTPRRGFQARLERLRAQSKGKQKAKAPPDSDDEAMSIQMSWDDDENDILDIEVVCTLC